MPITTDVVSSNLDQANVINFVSDLQQVGSFLRVLQFPPPNKTSRHNITWNIVESGIKLIQAYHQYGVGSRPAL